MMASSPSCSSTSPSASTATNVTDLQETDAFSDDSGVDVKPQDKGYLHFSQDVVAESNKRNKRKSSEPKKRKDVLLMKRFRWDTDEEDIRYEEDNDDVFDVLERERPSSGDSGCQLETHPPPPPSTAPPSQSSEKKKKQRQWRKPKTETVKEEEEDEDVSTTFRQSVICKNETATSCSSSSSIVPHSQESLPTVSSLSGVKASPIAVKGLSVQSATPSSKDYEVALDGQEDGPRTSRTAGRPRNYKSMSRQRRIEANARERTRVHTISAAFESLRRAVPAYAHNQKLSKLAILRIASAYIVALACLNGQATDGSVPPSMAECVERCTRTIQAEGRSRRRTSKVSEHFY